MMIKDVKREARSDSARIEESARWARPSASPRGERAYLGKRRNSQVCTVSK